MNKSSTNPTKSPKGLLRPAMRSEASSSKIDLGKIELNKIRLSEIDLSKIDLSEIDIKDAGSWPPLGRVAIYGFALLITLISGYFFYLQPELTSLNSIQQQEPDLIQVYEKKAFQGANLPAYRQQILALQQEISRLTPQLPANKSIPELIEHIGEKAQQHHVLLHSLKLKPEQTLEKYSAQPFTLTISGHYHNLGLFLAALNQLERIVTLGNFTLEPSEQQLKLVIEATTYHRHFNGPSLETDPNHKAGGQ